MKTILEKIAASVKDVVPGNLLSFSKEDLKILDELEAGRKFSKEQAIAVLVSEIALCDLEFDKKEYDYLFSYFKATYGLKDGQIRNLIQQGTMLMANLQTTEQFAEHLVEVMTLEERTSLVKMVSGLIKADDVEHGFELYLFERLERLLGVNPPRESSS